MCGINGIFAYHSAAGAIDREELIRTRGHMARGPETRPISELARCGLPSPAVHHRPRRPEPSRWQSADGSLVVTFNGEIYKCPVYNYMLAQGAKIGAYEVPASAMHGLGTPEDLDAYLTKRSVSAKGLRA